MARVVIGDRRYNLGANRDGWKMLAEFTMKDVAPSTDVPTWLVSNWESKHSILGYSTFRGFTSAQALKILSLAKASRGNHPKVHLSINRWGDISSYKLREMTRS